MASDLGITKQESDFHSDLSCNLHKNYMTRVELRKKQEELAAAPVLDSASIPELLNRIVDKETRPKVSSLPDE